MKLSFKEFLVNEGKFPGSPQRKSEMKADPQGTKVRAKRQPKNLPDERDQAMGRRTQDGDRQYKGKQYEKNQ